MSAFLIFAIAALLTTAAHSGDSLSMQGSFSCKLNHVSAWKFRGKDLIQTELANSELARGGLVQINYIYQPNFEFNMAFSGFDSVFNSIGNSALNNISFLRDAVLIDQNLPNGHRYLYLNGHEAIGFGMSSFLFEANSFSVALNRYENNYWSGFALNNGFTEGSSEAQRVALTCAQNGDLLNIYNSFNGVCDIVKNCFIDNQ